MEIKMNNKIATVFGGAGFVGRQIVKELAALGYRIKVATRVPESAYFLKPAGDIGQIVPVLCNYSDAASVTQAVRGSAVVINCIGILFERGKRSTFKKAHIDIPALIAQACADEKIGAFVHISALGVDQNKSRYAKSKLEGEVAIFKHFPKAVILRPSVIFGEDDNFLNMFAELARYLPVLPLIGGGKTKFQPVFVGDVARATLAAINDPAAQGKIFELGGPEILTFREIYELLFEYTGRRRCLMALPFGMAKIQASFLSLLPQPLLTPDQVESLKTDSVVGAGRPGLENLGIEATSLNTIVPEYLAAYRAGGRFASVRQ
jgi:NADH dehydrogenase